jgi:hypothetical protein
VGVQCTTMHQLDGTTSQEGVAKAAQTTLVCKLLGFPLLGIHPHAGTY